MPPRHYHTARRFMKHPVRKRIVYRFLLVVLPLLIVSIFVTGLALSWTNYTYFKKNIDRNYADIIRSCAGEIDLYIENAQKGMESLALMISAAKLDPWQKEMALTAFQHTAVEFLSVSLISPEGRKTASTASEQEPIDVLENETFLKALGGQDARSEVMLTVQSIPYLHLAVPVVRMGEVVEVLWGELNLKSVWDVLDGIHVGRTGNVFIIHASGRLLGHREMDRVVSMPPRRIPEWVTTLRDADGPIHWSERGDHSKLYCLGYYVPRLEWAIVLTQSQPEIFAYLHRNVYLALAVTCMICVGAGLLGWNWTRGLLKPVRLLHAQVRRVGRGDLDQKVSVDSHDEIGDLGLAFNDMIDSLKNHITREVETAKELVHARNVAVLGMTSSKVTHEVGNLLNNLGLTLSVLKGEDLSSRGQKAVAVMEKDGARVRAFIHDFLQFAKRPELQLAQVSLASIVEEIVFVHQPEAEKRGIHLEVHWGSTPPAIQADRRLLHQVFHNLIKNGLEALEGPGTVRIESTAEAGHCIVRVSDTGPGMDPAVRDQIFDPFFTTKGKKGTGLGLSVVRSIVEAHRGTVHCESAPQKGTTFSLRFPLR